MHSNFPGLIRLLTLAALAVAQAAFAQGAKTYPDKPVRVVVGYSPGGLPDTIARVIGQKLSERWGQQFVVENKPGANGILGADFVAKAAPDGYTLLMTDNSTHAINPFLYSKLPYDADRDLIPVSLTARAPLFLAVHSSVNANSFQELVAINSLRRSDLAPDVPAIAETIPGFDFAPTFGLFAPNGTPRDIILKIGADVAQVVKLPDVVERMKSLGIDPLGVSGDEWAKLLKSDAERYAKAVKISGAKVD